MKYSVCTKFIAIILCACSLVTLAFSGIGIAFMEGYDLYQTPISVKQEEQMEMVGSTLAHHHAQAYAVSTLSNVPEEVLYDIGYHYSYPYNYGGYLVDICENGEVVSSEGRTTGEQIDREHCFEYRQMVRTTYPVVTSEHYLDENGMTVEESTAAAASEDGAVPANERSTDEALARVADQEALYTEEYDTPFHYNEELGYAYRTTYTINYYEGPEYEVRVYLQPDAMIGADFKLVTVLYPYRDYFIPGVLASLVVFAVSFVFLCTVAGRARNGEVKLAAINRIPLDLYGLCLTGLIVLLTLPVIWLFESAYYNNTAGIWDNPRLCLLICCLCGLGIGLCAIGFLYAFAAQVKASNNYWMRHTAIGWCFGLLGKGLGWVGRGLKVAGRGLKVTGSGIRAVFVILPTIWQWLLTAFLMVACPLFFLFCAAVAWRDFWTFLWGLLFFGTLAGDVAIVCYGGWCFGTLLKGIETMSKGNLNYQIDTKYLYGTFKDLAVQLNSLADAAKIAAERQMKSERMKTELITNVSHDIKTPLTSIINFVDLMKKPHTEAEGEEYLAVLDRQSQRLKKLIDDLMDMSKASSGTMTVELGQVDAVEAVNQALGEFADKLDRVSLTPVFRHPNQTVTMIADGKLLWRILSNILNNAVKYALPDTRLYVDLMVLQGNAVIAIKNISREQLNVNADELMERFVRGDTSRNTEGSGLGLNIAKSLTELQGGQMHLMVDGDLFKVTLIFPLA